jgi:hypothetical protein
METPNGHGWVWPNIESFHPGTGHKIYHWKASIWHHQVGFMEAHYQTDGAAMDAVQAMLGGTPDDWQSR